MAELVTIDSWALVVESIRGIIFKSKLEVEWQIQVRAVLGYLKNKPSELLWSPQSSLIYSPHVCDSRAMKIIRRIK